MKFFLIGIIRFYQKAISPYLPRACRFYPSCSEYAIQCLSKCNFFYAFFLIMKRILKCNPLFEGGFDPVPCNHKIQEFNQTDGKNGREKL